MNRTYIKDTLGEIGKEVVLKGWVDVRRDHGKLIFIDLRDVTGVVQTVFFAGNKEVYEIANTLRPEWVVEIQGIVQERPESMRNANIPTGGIEISGTTIEVLNQSQTPPFDLGGDGREIGEEHRLTYRYLDLRRPRLKKNFVLRHKITKFIRDFLDSKGFIEVETPILTKSTPEGARDYLVPSRLQQGSFYALPQSPQQYKQLLMVAGLERYFQIARCFRDEDTRGDRQPEFTQLDLEMSFVAQEDVMAVNEKFIID